MTTTKQYKHTWDMQNRQRNAEYKRAYRKLKKLMNPDFDLESGKIIVREGK